VSNSGRVYHIDTNPPEVDGVDDEDGSPLIIREDDKPETVKNRLETYHRQTVPLIDYYESRGILHRFDGTRPPTEVHDHVRATLATLRLEERL
jgi:adenylate kinase